MSLAVWIALEVLGSKWRKTIWGQLQSRHFRHRSFQLIFPVSVLCLASRPIAACDGGGEVGVLYFFNNRFPTVAKHVLKVSEAADLQTVCCLECLGPQYLT